MSANSAFQIVNEHGWRMGFANLLRKENRDWWRTRRWWINAIIWLLLINGIAYAMLWSPVPDPADPNPETAERILLPAEVAVPSALMNLVIMAGLFTPIGAIITMQGTIIDEKKSGTAAWIMSKPVSRSAFIISKLLANSVALLLISIFVQWVVAYILLTARGGTFAPVPFAFGVALLGLHLLFYITMTLMLGTFFNDRAPVIAIPHRDTVRRPVPDEQLPNNGINLALGIDLPQRRGNAGDRAGDLRDTADDGRADYCNGRVDRRLHSHRGVALRA